MSEDNVKEFKELADETNKLIKSVREEVSVNKQETAEQKSKFEKMETRFNELVEKQKDIEEDNAKLKALKNFSVDEVNEKKKKAIELESKCFKEFMQRGNKGQDFYSFLDYSEKGRELKELRTDVADFGGYLTGTQLGGMIASNRSEVSDVTNDCSLITLSGNANSIEFPLDDDDIIQASPVGEGSGTSSTATETLGRVELKPYELMRKVKLTATMIEDVANSEQWIAGKVARGMRLKEENGVWQGTGVGLAKGILTYDADASTAYGAYTRDKIQVVNSGSAADINDTSEIDDMIKLLKPEYYANAKLYMHSTTAFRLLKLLDADNRPLIDPNYEKNPLKALTFRGFQISLQQGMPVIAANAKAIAFGDLKEAYTVVRKSGIRIIRDIYTSDNNIIIKTTERFGGAVTNFEAVKVMKVAA